MTAQRRTFERLDAFAEERSVLLAFLVALIARAALALAVSVLFDGFLFEDDQTFHRMATEYAAGDTSRWDNYTWQLFDQVRAYLWPIAVLYSVLGAHVIIGQLLTALLGASVAALTALLLSLTVTRRLALAGGLAVGLFPSQVLWSSIIMKDAAVWATLAALAVLVAVINRQDMRSGIAGVGGVAVLLVVLGNLRVHTLVVACWALVLAIAIGARKATLTKLVPVAALALAVPWAFGGGPGGIDIVTGGLGSLEDIRVQNAKGADTAIVKPHDDGPKPGVWDNIEHLPVGLRVMLLEPLPWSDNEGIGHTLARIETVVWYPALLLAAVGALGIARRRATFAFPFFAGGGVMLLYALAEGNVGTAYRHRGEFVWAVLAFAVLGIHRLLSRRSPEPDAAILEDRDGALVPGVAVQESGDVRDGSAEPEPQERLRR